MPEPVTVGLTAALFWALSKLGDKLVDAAWEPADQSLKGRVLGWFGQSQERKRRAAFDRAVKRARESTLRSVEAARRDEVRRILDALDTKVDAEPAEALAEESARLMLFSSVPDLPRLTRVLEERLRWDQFWGKGTAPSTERVAGVLQAFLVQLREALLDEEPYRDFVQGEALRELRKIAARLEPRRFDDEASYRYQLAKVHGHLDFVGMGDLKDHRSVGVEEVFIPLKTRPAGDINADAVDFSKALQSSRCLVLLGGPGSGKTTLLKYVTFVCAEERAEDAVGLTSEGGAAPLPIYLPLREFVARAAERRQDYNLIDGFRTYAYEHLTVDLPPEFFREALEEERCVVCLDGLDEVGGVGERRAVCEAIRALPGADGKNRILVTSRQVGYDEAPLDGIRFTCLMVAPLGLQDDVPSFIRKWYEIRERDRKERRRKITSLTRTIETEPRIQALATNPLLLTIIALVHRVEMELPHERVRLYDRCVTALVDTWDKGKGAAPTAEEKERPYYQLCRRLLEQLAYALHSRAGDPEEFPSIKEGDLELALIGFLQGNRRLTLADDPDTAREEARAFIQRARRRTGLLIELTLGAFGFAHPTFQEYLAACDIQWRKVGADTLWDEISPRLHEPRWREVILLLLGNLNRYEDLPTLLVERILNAGDRDPEEPRQHRHLYLAARALADRVAVDDSLCRQIVDRLAALVREGTPTERQEALVALSNLKHIPHATATVSKLAGDPDVVQEIRDAAAALLPVPEADL